MLASLDGAASLSNCTGAQILTSRIPLHFAERLFQRKEHEDGKRKETPRAFATLASHTLAFLALSMDSLKMRRLSLGAQASAFIFMEC